MLVPRGGHSNGKRGYQARPWTHKKHPNHVLFRYEKRPWIRVFACIFLNLLVMYFPKFVYMTKNTPFFSNFARFCTPKQCTRVQCLVLKNNPNYVNFWTSMIPPLTFEWPPRGWYSRTHTKEKRPKFVTLHSQFCLFIKKENKQTNWMAILSTLESTILNETIRFTSKWFVLT